MRGQTSRQHEVAADKCLVPGSLVLKERQLRCGLLRSGLPRTCHPAHLSASICPVAAHPRLTGAPAGMHACCSTR